MIFGQSVAMRVESPTVPAWRPSPPPRRPGVRVPDFLSSARSRSFMRLDCPCVDEGGRGLALTEMGELGESAPRSLRGRDAYSGNISLAPRHGTGAPLRE